MTWLRTLLARLRALWRAEHIHGEIDEELQFHIDMQTEENIRRGLKPEEARRDAEQRFGPLTRIKELGYDVRGGGWLEALLQDLRFGLRMLLRKPGFTLASVVTLALGIAATVSILTVVNSVLLRPLPFPDADRLVVLFATTPGSGIYRDTTSFPDFLDWKTQSHSFTGVAAYRLDPFNVTGVGAPERVIGLRASHELFNVLEMSPAIGRGFNKQEQEEKSAVAVISHGLWVRRFASDAGVLGMRVLLNDVSHDIIGVLPPAFQFPSFTHTDVIVPVPERPSRSTGYIRGIARLQRGVPEATAQRELDTIAERLAQTYPLSNRGRGVKVVQLQHVVVGNVRTPLLVLMGAALFVLLIGCANVGGLVLARGIARRQELALRTALGAEAGRLVRQLLTESISLALIAALLGIAFAFWGSQILAATLSQRFPLPGVNFDWSLLALAAGIALLTGVLCGLPPALMVWRSEPTNSLNQGSRSQSGGPIRHRLRSLLVIAETALTIMLLVGAGLLLKSFVLLQQIDPGFDPRNVVTADLVLSKRYEEPERRQIFLGELLDSIGGLPGVQQAAVLTNALSGGGARETFSLEGHPDAGPRQGHPGDFNVVSSEFFRAAGIPLKLGRSFDQQDNSTGRAVAIVNETMIRQFWPNENPIGKRIRLYYDKDPQHWLSIVGVVGDVRDRGREVEPRPYVFVPYQQPNAASSHTRSPYVSLIVRTDDDPARRITGVRSRIWAVDKDQPVSNLQTMEQALSSTTADRRIYLQLLGGFAAIALIMAISGIYSLIAYAAASRTHEMGIRVALGATTGQILRLVLRHGVILMLIGVSIGIAGSLVLTKVLSGFLYATTATDLPTFILMTLLFVAVGLFATYIPARRAARIDPTVAFRYE